VPLTLVRKTGSRALSRRSALREDRLYTSRVDYRSHMSPRPRPGCPCPFNLNGFSHRSKYFVGWALFLPGAPRHQSDWAVVASGCRPVRFGQPDVRAQRQRHRKNEHRMKARRRTANLEQTKPPDKVIFGINSVDDLTLFHDLVSEARSVFGSLLQSVSAGANTHRTRSYGRQSVEFRGKACCFTLWQA
jgi:hypothetical protein